MKMAKRDTSTVAPRLRFPEFREAWVTDSIGNLGSFMGGGTPDKSVEAYWDGSIPWISSSDLVEDSIYDLKVSRHITPTAVSASATKIIPKGSLLFVSRVGVGKVAIADRDICTSQDFTNFQPAHLLNSFVAYFFSAHKWILKSFSQGTSIKGFTKEDLANFQLPFPELAEQQKIADCLTSLDKVIAAQGRKVEALKAHKRGLMQRLFPREGESRPRLRFPEFLNAPEWESKTLGEICSISSGVTPLRSDPEFYEGGDVPWVKTTDLNNSFICATQECVTSKAKVTINPVGSVAVAMYGGFNQIGRTGLLRIPAATNQALSVLRVRKEAAVPIYLLTWLNAKVEEWKRIASSSRKDPNITSADVARFPICVPSLAEQQRIADYLSSLDTRIAAEADQIAALKTHKQGLMQQLFPTPGTASV